MSGAIALQRTAAACPLPCSQYLHHLSRLLLGQRRLMLNQAPVLQQLLHTMNLLPMLCTVILQSRLGKSVHHCKSCRVKHGNESAIRLQYLPVVLVI